MDRKTAWQALRDVARTYYFLPQFVVQRSVELAHLRHLRYDHPILDLGCGDATFTRLLFPNRKSVDFGLDPEGDQLERARETGIFRELFHAPGDRIPLPDESIETVFSNSVFEHIPAIEPILDESRRVLRPGGRLVFTTPSEHFHEFLFFTRRYREWGFPAYAEAYGRFVDSVFAHHRYWTFEQWTGALEARGFAIELHEEIVSPKAAALEDAWFVRQLALRTLAPNLAKKTEKKYSASVGSSARRPPRSFFQSVIGRFLAAYLWRAYWREEIGYRGAGSQRLIVARKR